MNGYETPNAWLRKLAKETNTTLNGLTVLAPQNDVFRMGTKTQLKQAEWFAEVWSSEGFGTGTHIRRVHYRLASHGNKTRHDGEPYLNTTQCEAYINTAAVLARALGLLDAREFVDRRNPPPYIYDYSQESQKPFVGFEDAAYFRLPLIDNRIPRPCLRMPSPELHNYRYCQADQPYLVEVWIEKSTMNDELRPICQNLRANMITSLGFQSHTAAVNLIDRCLEHGKPGRVLYISDFDPAGDNMPVTVSRQLEFRKREYPHLDISLQPLALTQDQVRKYQLPRTPIDESVLAKQRFEERYGEGAVELDAMAALMPGELERIVSSAINDYRDPNIRDEIDSAADDTESELYEFWEAVTTDIHDELEAIEREAEEVISRYRKPLGELSDKLNSELEPYRERAAELEQTANLLIEDFEFDLPNRPKSAGIVRASEIEPYFDSRRSYMEQLPYHLARKGK